MLRFARLQLDASKPPLQLFDDILDEVEESYMYNTMADTSFMPKQLSAEVAAELFGAGPSV